MSQPTFVIGTLVLNELEWLPKLYHQHKDWPGLVEWVFVEAADLVYARTSPEMVKRTGTHPEHVLSCDGTTEYLEELSKQDDRIIHIKHGITSHLDPAQGKCAARQRYLDVANQLKPEFVKVLDADEFLTKKAQRCMFVRSPHEKGWVVRQRHLWYPPYLQNIDSNTFGLPFDNEVIGGYWSVPHARLWRWQLGMEYTNDHNIPYGYGIPKKSNHVSECQHMGFASGLKMRRAKHSYYIARGETQNRLHKMYVDCRAAWESWKPGDVLPHRAEVIPYLGEIPECFR